MTEEAAMEAPYPQPEDATALAPAYAEARAYLERAKAPGTLRAYRADWRHFAAWCGERGQGSPSRRSGHPGALPDRVSSRPSRLDVDPASGCDCRGPFRCGLLTLRLLRPACAP